MGPKGIDLKPVCEKHFFGLYLAVFRVVPIREGVEIARLEAFEHQYLQEGGARIERNPLYNRHFAVFCCRPGKLRGRPWQIAGADGGGQIPSLQSEQISRFKTSGGPNLEILKMSY